MRGDRRRGPRPGAVTAVTVAAAVALVGCGPSAEERAQILTDGADERSCEQLLSGEAAMALSGKQGAYRTHTVGTLPACQALTSGDHGLRISMVRVPGAQWAASQERTFTDLLPTDPADPDTEPRVVELMESLRAGTLTDDEGCELFTALARETYDPDGPVVVATAPVGGLKTVSGQACAGGQFALVTMESTREIELTPELTELFTAAVDEVHPEDLASAP